MQKLEKISFPAILDKKEQDILRVFESRKTPFDIQRIFTVSASSGTERGKHAHKLCNQILTCVSGRINLLCDDGEEQFSVVLYAENDGVLVPSGIWAQQTYLEDCSVLLVICDQAYDENDYIRDHDEFLIWKAKNR